MFVLAVQTEIFDTGYCWIVHLSFLTSHNLLFFRFCKTSKKTTFSVFLSFFLLKSPKSQSLKLNISRTAWPIWMILLSFCRILNGLSDEINLFWRCSSPLRIMDTMKLMSLFWIIADVATPIRIRLLKTLSGLWSSLFCQTKENNQNQYYLI